MPNASTLKEYLVKLGWKNDVQGYEDIKGKVNGLGRTIKEKLQLPGSIYKSLAGALTPIVAVNSAIAAAAKNMAKLDQETERTARKLWTSKDNAYALNNALSAMGKSYEDIFWMTPEEFSQFKELKSLSSYMKPPAELQGMLKTVRAILNEANKFKMILTQGKQWVAYYLGKMIGGDLNTLLDKIKNFNNYLVQKLPVITKKIADFFYIFYRFGKTGVELVQSLYTGAKNLFDGLDEGSKKVALALTALFLLIKTSPIGPFIALFYALFLLLDDFFTYKKGGKSYYAEQWEAMTKLFKSNGGESALSALKEDVQTLLGSVGRLGEKFGILADKINLSEIAVGVFELLVGLVDGVITTVTLAADAISTMIDWIMKAGSAVGEFFGHIRGNEIEDPVVKIMKEKGLWTDPYASSNTAVASSTNTTNSNYQANYNQQNTFNFSGYTDVEGTTEDVMNGASKFFGNRDNASPYM